MRALFLVLLLFVFVPPALAAEAIYMCPMHPHISGEKGDDCPICGMSLVAKEDEGAMEDVSEDHSAAADGAFSIDPSYMQDLGVKTAKVTHRKFGRNIRAFGQIVTSSRLEYAVDVRTKGWIVDLATDAVGDTVKKGDLLFTYYSPELMEAQSDFLLGRRVGRAEQRLRLHGMGAKAIAELKRKGDFLEETPFYARQDGTITALNVRKGSHVNEGGSIMKIQDFSKLWVNVEVPLRDAQFLAVGTPATVAVSETGDEYRSSVDFIHPVNNPQTHTVVVRLVLDNEKGELKAGTYVDAVLNAKVRSRLAMPAEAILYGNMGAYVIESMGDGYFKPVMVKTGVTANGLTEIKRGLKRGQRVVTSGQFMLDAESNLRGGMAAMGHEHGGTTEMKGPQRHEQH